MPAILLKGQIPKRTAEGTTLAASSSLFPRSTGLVSSTNPLAVGDIVETTEGRAQVTAVAGGRATLMLEFLDHDGGRFFTVQSSGTDAI